MYARVTIFDAVEARLRGETRTWVDTESQRLERERPGYQGVLTLVDGENRRTPRIHLFDNEEHAREAHAILDGDPPASLPESSGRWGGSGRTSASARSSSATGSDAEEDGGMPVDATARALR